MLPRYSAAGLLSIIASEVLMFIGIEPFATFFTPIVWWSYIFFIDGVIYRIKGASLIMSRRRDFLLMLPFSVGFWLIFEAYNLLLKNWRYVGLPEEVWLRWLGYGLSFATITPGIIETAELLAAIGIFKAARSKKLMVTNGALTISMAIGAAFLLYPIIRPSPYLFAFVWLGFIFLLDPVNYRLRGRSLLGELESGSYGTAASLFAAGFVCGFLWEFWNYWARAKWLYSVPILGDVKIFEMPVVGYLGFGPFALEVYVMFHWAKATFRF